MAFTVTDFADLTRLLAQRPVWQAELRRLILSEDFLALPQAVRELSAVQQRTEVQVQELAAAQQRTEVLMQELAREVRALAEAQRRTEQRVEELAEAQRHTEQRVEGLESAIERLAEAQRRTEQRVEGLESAVERLAEAQRRTEQRVEGLESAVERLAEAQWRTEQRVEGLESAVERLAEAQWRTEQRVEGLSTSVGELQRAFGSTIEEEAESFVQELLEQKGYRLLAEPYSLALDGEVDVVMELEAPTGQGVWAVVEAKARLGYRQVRGWGHRMKSSGWQQRLVDYGVTGPYLVYAFGIRIDPGAVRAAEEQGIGLLTGRGERVAPEGLIRSPGG